MTLEAKKLSIIEQILALEEESVLDAILSEIEQSKATAGLDVLQEEEVSYQTAQNGVESIEKEEPIEKKLDFRDAIVEIRENVILEDLIEEQNYTSCSYEEFEQVASQINWGKASLEELLEALD